MTRPNVQNDKSWIIILDGARFGDPAFDKSDALDRARAAILENPRATAVIFESVGVLTGEISVRDRSLWQWFPPREPVNPPDLPDPAPDDIDPI